MKVPFYLCFLAIFILFSGCSHNTEPTAPAKQGSETVSSGNSTGEIQTNNYIPLVLVLYENTAYGGLRRVIVEDNCDLAALSDFNDIASSVAVCAGPSYNEYKLLHGGKEPTVTLYENTQYSGASIVLRVGNYSSLGCFGMSKKVSSIQFLTDPNPLTPDSQPDGNFDTIHTILKLYKSNNYGGSFITILGTTNTEYKNWNDLNCYFGFDYKPLSYEALPGPNSAQNLGIKLWTNTGFSGKSLVIYSGRSVKGVISEDSLKQFLSYSGINY